MSDREPEGEHDPGDGSARRRISQLVLDKPTEILGLLAAIPTLFYGLGLLTHSSRESLIQLGLPLSYPHQNAILVSLDVLWSLPWNALTALFAGGGVSWAAWIFLVLLGASFGIDQIRGKGRLARWGVPIWIAVVWFLLYFAVAHYRAALFPQHAPGGLGASFHAGMGPKVAQQIETEVVSWLRNDSELNQIRRSALAGLYPWLLLTLVAHAVLIRHQTGWWPPLRRIYLAAYVVLAALIVSDLPRAHVIATWGVSYPTVQLRENEECDAALRTAIASRRCCGYDVSAGGTPRVTLLLGEGCPEGAGFRSWSPEESHCLLTGARKVVDADDC